MLECKWKSLINRVSIIKEVCYNVSLEGDFRRISLSEQTSSGWAIMYICSVKLSSVDVVRSLGGGAFSILQKSRR